MRLARITVYVLIAVLGVGVIGSGIATGAGKKKVKTKVTITFKGSDYGDSFTGRVKAKAKGTPKVKRKLKRKCVKRRKVVVFRKLTTGKQRIGKTRSNRRGRWVRSVNGLADPGRYFAVAKRKKIRHKGKRYVCKKGRSKRILVS